MNAIVNVPELRFPEFSGDWLKEKLGNLTNKIGSGSTPKGGQAVYTSSGILFIRSQNVTNNKLELNDPTYISDEINSKMKGSIVLPLDILLNITGASIGRSCVVPENFNIGNVNQHVCIVRLNNDNFPYFIQLLLSSRIGQKLIFQEQAGGGREGLNFQSIASFKLQIPSLPEQQKIAQFLTTVDTKIEQLTKKKTLLEQYKKGVSQKLFSQEIRFKADDGSDYPDWVEKKLGDVVKYYDGTHQTPKYVEKGIPFYSVEHVTANKFSETKYISEAVFEKENKRVSLEKGDILMTRIGSIGVAKYIDWDVEASFYVSLALIKHNNNYNSQFLNQQIQCIFFQRELWKRTIHVAFPKKINLGEIGQCNVLFPSLPEQEKIANFLSSIDTKIDLATKQLNETKQFKKALLQLMFV